MTIIKTSFLDRYPDIESVWSDSNPLPPDQVSIWSKEHLFIICPEHGEHSLRADSYTLGARCPKCGPKKRANTIRKATLEKNGDLLDDHPELRELRPSGRGIPANPRTRGRKRDWKCPLCGHQWRITFIQQIAMGAICPKCNEDEWEEKAKSVMRRGLGSPRSTGSTRTVADYPELVAQWHPDNDLAPSEVSQGSAYRARWHCEAGHEWSAFVFSRTAGTGCPSCAYSRGRSKAEEEVHDLIVSWGITAVASDRSLIAPYELDIYLPDHDLAIEYNGVYWHSEATGRGRWHHYRKWKRCHDAGIQLITVWEDDWRDRPEVVESVLRQRLEPSPAPGRARAATVAEVSAAVAGPFLDAHHLKGAATEGFHLGLFHDEELVAVSSWVRHGDDALLLSRYCSAAPVVDGLRALLDAGVARARELGLSRIVAVSDNEVSDGSVYAALGFTAAEKLAPDFSYLYEGSRRHKSVFRVSWFEVDPSLVYDPDLTEVELAAFNEIYRVWGYGGMRWTLDLTPAGSGGTPSP